MFFFLLNVHFENKVKNINLKTQKSIVINLKHLKLLKIIREGKIPDCFND